MQGSREWPNEPKSQQHHLVASKTRPRETERSDLNVGDLLEYEHDQTDSNGCPPQYRIFLIFHYTPQPNTAKTKMQPASVGKLGGVHSQRIPSNRDTR